MIKGLQRKITAIIASVLVAVFVVVFITLNISMQISSYEKTASVLQILIDYDGYIFLPQSEATMEQQDSPFPTVPPSGYVLFYIKVNEQNDIIEANHEMIYDMTPMLLEQYKNDMLAQNKRSGTSGDYQFLIQETAYGKIIACAQRGYTVEMLRDLVRTSTIVAGISCVALLGLSVLLARRAVKPVKEAFDKQRRFISDASHELKTPLTVIMTNIDILRNEWGESTELDFMHDQARNMNLLIQEMLTLARTEENKKTDQYVAFDLSSAVRNIVLGFESTAFEAGKNMTYDIMDNIHYIGDKRLFLQVICIFIDNAIQYSEAGAAINIRLQKDGNKIKLSFYNTGIGIKNSEKEKIFERFYRSDESRSRETGGYGLGLAIAKSIVQQHGGKISVEGEEGQWVRFTIRL
ncbi:MAG: sensor histidine kinase [Sphaerochaetaceae bacterium]